MQPIIIPASPQIQGYWICRLDLDRKMYQLSLLKKIGFNGGKKDRVQSQKHKLLQQVIEPLLRLHDQTGCQFS